MTSAEREKIYFPMFCLCILLLVVNVYWFSYECFEALGATGRVVDHFLGDFYKAGIYRSSYLLRLFTLLAIFLTSFLKAGKSTNTSWQSIITIIGVGLLLFFFPYLSPLLYLVFTTMGFIALFVGIALLGRKLRHMKIEDNDVYETFEQCDEKIETEYSINIPTIYQYQKKKHHGWINILAPFRSLLIFGTPGSGKSYSLVWPILETEIRKGFSMLVYDFKMPDLTEITYNKYLQYKGNYVEKYGKAPQFCLINFNDPRQSMRCNPLDARYITDKADAFEIAEILLKNTTKGNKEDNFWTQSAKAFTASYVMLLKKYKNGIYCTFPHLIELMGINYAAVLEILSKDEETMTMVQSFVDSMKEGAQEQLQGQIASARIPMLEFDSSALYWVLTGNDFSLDLNNIDEPKILCIGNDPKRMSVYGPALALYMARIIRIINAKRNLEGKRNIPCSVLVDEFPTIYMKGIGELIDTARSNKVSVTLACQDKDQIKLNYGPDEADVVMNSPGTILSGQVNGGTARYMSEMLGKEYRVNESSTSGSEGGDTISTSYQLRELLPQSRIETLTNGYFFGKVADDSGSKITSATKRGVEIPGRKGEPAILERKFFCGKVDVDVKGRSAEQKNWKPIPNFGAGQDEDGNYHGDVFGDRKIEEEVMRDKESKDSTIFDYLLERLKNEDRNRKKNDFTYVMMNDMALSSLTQEKFESLSENDYDEILKKALQKKKDDHIKQVLDDNVRRIRLDILSMFEDYGIDPMNFNAKTDDKPIAYPKIESPEGGNKEDQTPMS